MSPTFSTMLTVLQLAQASVSFISSRKLFLMHILDTYLTVEGNRLKWIHENQQTKRAKNYKNLTNFVKARRHRAADKNATNNIVLNNNDTKAVKNNIEFTNNQNNNNPNYILVDSRN
jgi:hypothetical protein